MSSLSQLSQSPGGVAPPIVQLASTAASTVAQHAGQKGTDIAAAVIATAAGVGVGA